MLECFLLVSFCPFFLFEDAVERIVIVWILVGDQVEYCHEPDIGGIQWHEPDGEDLPDVEVDLVAGCVVYCAETQEECQHRHNPIILQGT